MNGLIKQLFTTNSQVAQLTEHKTEDLRRTCWCGSNPRVLEKIFLIFARRVIVEIQLFHDFKL